MIVGDHEQPKLWFGRNMKRQRNVREEKKGNLVSCLLTIFLPVQDCVHSSLRPSHIPPAAAAKKALVVIVTKANMENFMVVLRWTGTVFVEEGMDNNL